MTHGTIDRTEQLAQVRRDLLTAIEGDRRRSRQRRRRRVAGLVLAATFVSGTAAAATNGFFDAAPGWVKDIFGGQGGVDASSAVQVGVIDDHVVYAAPSEDGGFCLDFGPNMRSGPSGLGCVPGGTDDGQIVMTLELGHDGGFVIGRVAASDATAVALSLPAEEAPVTTTVREDGFFLVKLPAASMKVLLAEDVTDQARLSSLIGASAADASGASVARSSVVHPPLGMGDVVGASAAPSAAP